MPAPETNDSAFTLNIFMDEIVLRQVDDETFSLALDIQTFAVMWKDPRVELKENDSAMDFVEKEFATKLWTPHLSLEGSKTFTLEDHLAQSGKFLTKGLISLWTSLPLKLWCKMEFNQFPLDSQVELKPLHYVPKKGHRLILDFSS